MKTLFCAFSLLLIFIGSCTSWAEVYQTDADYQSSGDYFSPEELDDLLAPIALYPDPLIAQILPAATFADQIKEAAYFVRRNGTSRIDYQPWDVSVKAIAHYPNILFMMDKRYEWTIALGQAVVYQEQDVMDAIQVLRADARAAGTLVSTPQQDVIVEGDDIRIVPAEARVIYVPQYDPDIVFAGMPYPSYGLVTFSVGFGIGSWLNRDCDWHRHRIYYHGWRSGGWVYRTRPYVDTRNRTYIDRRYRDIRLNRRVVERDTLRFRNDLRRDVGQRRVQGRPPRPDTMQRRTRAVAPRTVPSTPTGQPRTQERSRQPRSQAAPVPGGGADVRTYRQQGRTSRDSLRQSSPASPAAKTAPRVAPPRTERGVTSAPAVRQQIPETHIPESRVSPSSGDRESGGRPSRSR